MKKRKLSLLLVTTIVTSLFVGCGSSSSKSDKTVVTVMQNKVEIQEQLENAAKKFNESQEEVEVKILGVSGSDYDTNLQTQLASSPEKAATIFTTSGGPEGERFKDFMEPIEGSKAAENIAEGLDKGTIFDGKLYGLPTTVEGVGLIYNKDIFKSAGVDPTTIKSMEDLQNACKKLETVDGVDSAIGFATESYFKFMHFYNWPFATDEKYMDAIEKLNKGEMTLKDYSQVSDFTNELDKLKVYTNKAKSTYDEQVAGFATGKYAIIHQGNWAQNLMNEYEISFDYGMLPVPMNGNEKLAVDVASYYRVNKYATDDQKAGAVKFLDWLLTSDEGKKIYVEEFKFIPAYNGFDVSTLDKLAQEVSKYTEAGNTVPWAFTYFPTGAHQEFANTLEKYYADQINKDELLDELNKLWKDAANK